MKKSIREIITAHTLLICNAGIAGGALTLILAVVALITGAKITIVLISAAAVITALLGFISGKTAVKRLNAVISVPVEELAESGKTDVTNAPGEIEDIAARINSVKTVDNAVIAVLTKLADGDFSVKADGLSDSNEVSVLVKRLVGRIETALSSAAGTADFAKNGLRAVSDASSQLSVQAARQSAGLSELSDTIQKIEETVTDNAANAREANRFAAAATSDVEAGTGHMRELLSAMDNINKSTDEIAKFIKVIEDIAFQTNILALNSSVEAARAGEAGKGFAVVATEVKNLATRSQDAAQQTNDLIRSCVESVKRGSEKTAATAKALDAVSSETKSIAGLVDEICRTCEQQLGSIGAVNTSITEISSAVQLTESAAARCGESVSAIESGAKPVFTAPKFAPKPAAPAPKPAAPAPKPAAPAPKPVAPAPKPAAPAPKPAAPAPKPVAPAPKPVVAAPVPDTFSSEFRDIPDSKY
mgnify:CR=1 FL=1